MRIKSYYPIILVLLVGLAVRAVPALFGVITGDVKFILAYVLMFLQAPDTLHFYGAVKVLYHNPPLLILIDSLTYLASIASGISFAVLIKVWSIAADMGIIVLLWHWMGRDSGRGLRAAWIYALNPVSILVSGFHGQFDPVVILFVMASLFYLSRGDTRLEGDYYSRMTAYVLLGVGIALKDYPVLLLPFFLVLAARKNEEWKALTLILAPTVAVSLPFVLADFHNFRDAFLKFSGSPDFGTGGVIRLIRFIAGGYNFASVSAEFPALFLTVMKIAYLSFWGLLVVRFYRKSENIVIYAIALYLGFFIIYPGISAQYFFWIIPLLIVMDDAPVWRYSLLCAVCMCLFYLAYFPRILVGRMPLDRVAGWLPHFSIASYLLMNLVLWVYNIGLLLTFWKQMTNRYIDMSQSS
jgi:hypothetical protein